MTSQTCRKCGYLTSGTSAFCKECGESFNPAAPNPFQRVPTIYDKLCTSCGAVAAPSVKNKGSVMIEAILLILSFFALALSWTFAALLFVVFVVYCVWRLSSKQSLCPMCGNSNIIPLNSPVARNFLANR